MGQEFEWPNLLVGSMSGHMHYIDGGGQNLSGVRMRDGVVGDYYRVTLDADAKVWAYLLMTGAEGVGDVPEGTELAISIFTRINGGPCKLYPSIRHSNSTGVLHDTGTTTWDDVGGGWTLCVTRAARNAIAYDSQIFYVGLSIYKAGTTIDIAQPMVCVADDPHAWAPAEGEVWP